jgi:hypothetical protein
MKPFHNMLLVLICCAAILWIAGPAGRLVVVLPLLLFGPGYLLDRALRPAPMYSDWLRPALWPALSLSLVALLYAWATTLNLRLTPAVLGVFATGCALGILGWLWHDTRAAPSDAPPPWRAWQPATWGLLGVLLLTLGTRFVQIQHLVLPAWVDSVHHALLIRVAAESGQAPTMLRPYLPIDSLPYHWGYHVFAASLMQLTSLGIPETMLWSGQFFNTLHVLTCAALAAHFWRRPLAGVVAGLVVGLISIMPAYYVSWGRYTQLTGLLLLPPLAIIWDTWLRRPSRHGLVCAAVLLAGLSIIHMRVLVFALALLAVQFIVWAATTEPATLRARLLPALALAGGALALAFPWLWELAIARLAPAVENPDTLAGNAGYNALNEGLLWTRSNPLLIALALLAALWGLLRRARATAMMIGWLLLLALLANPWLTSYLAPAAGIMLAGWGIAQRRPLIALGGGVLLLLNPWLVSLPYLWLITNDVVIISLYIPISVLLGGSAYLLSSRLEASLPRWHLQRRAAGAIALTLLALWGTWNMRAVINQTTVFAEAPDVAAIEWVRDNTPPDARFLINSTAWFVTVDRGSDGGWWLMPLAGRWTSMPPALYTYGPPEYVQHVHATTRAISTLQPDQHDALRSLIQREAITHIYLGTQHGPLKHSMFADNTLFEQVYNHNGVTIFAVRQQSAAPADE